MWAFSSRKELKTMALLIDRKASLSCLSHGSREEKNLSHGGPEVSGTFGFPFDPTIGSPLES